MSIPQYKKTGAELRADAQTHDVDALLHLADATLHGWRGITQDGDRARDLERAAADHGSARGARRIADRFHRGEGVEEDSAEAMTWWRRAAELGDVDSMANLIPLKDSEHPTEAAEGRKWLAIAAARGQPYAVHTLRTMDSGTAQTTLAQFAAMSLEQMAANVEASSQELSLSVENVPASLEQINDLVGIWIDRLRVHWAQLATRSEIDGEPADFPCPDLATLPAGVQSDNQSIVVTLKVGAYHLQLDATLYDEGWSLTLGSFEPHPNAGEQSWLIGELRTVATYLQVVLPSVTGINGRA